MKSGWKECKIGDFAEVKGGKRLPKDSRLTLTPNSHPYIRIRDLGKSKTLELTPDYEYVDDETQAKISRYTVDAGDVLISVVGTIGLIGIVGETLHRANQTENCDKIVNLRDVDRDYLYYYLVSPLGQSEIEKATVGAVQPKLPIKNILDIAVKLPPLETQHKIASVLSSLDDKIELNDRINANLEEQAKAIFKSWFVDNALDAWKRGTFSDIIDGMLGGDWGKDSPSGNNSQMVYCIRGADIPDVCKGDKGKMPIRYILPKNFETKRLVDGDIVVEISGGSPTQSTGRAAIITQSLLDRYDKGVVCTNFCRAIKPKKGYSMFVYHYWQYLYDIDLFFSYENGTTGIKNLDISGVVKTEKISIAPKELVEKFNAVCDTIYGKIFENGLENEKLASLRDALLPRLLSGELDVSELNI